MMKRKRDEDTQNTPKKLMSAVRIYQKEVLIESSHPPPIEGSSNLDD
jgi:hypothetical protein